MTVRRQQTGRFVLWASLATCLIALWPATASANAVLPPAIMIFPTAWYLLPWIIVIEAWAGIVVVGWGVGRSFLISVIANLLSSLVGIPVAILDIGALKDFELRLWYFPALVVPLFAASVLVEGYVATMFTGTGQPIRPIWRWALIANSISYLLFLLVLCLSVAYVF